jgi:hypothetical protein
MPKAVPFDREAVKAVYLTCLNFKETASAFPGLKPATIRQWASRDSTWPTATNGKRLIEQGKAIVRVQAEKAHRDIVAPVTTAAEAIANLQEQHRENFIAGMSSGLSRAASVVGNMQGEEVVENSRKVHDLIQSGSKLFGIGQDSNAPGLTLNLLSLSADALLPR